MTSPANIIAITLLCGTVKFSVKQYEIVRVLLKYSNEKLQLPSYSMMQRKFFPHLLRNCFPRSKITTFPRRAEDHIADTEGGRLHRSESFTRVVLPTEWAQVDVATLPYFENIFVDPFGTKGRNASLGIEDSQIVRNRDPIVNPARYLFVDDRHGKTPATAGDVISFKLSNTPPGLSLHELTDAHFCTSQTTQDLSILGRIVSTWCVGSPSTESDSGKEAVSNAPQYLQPIIRAMIKGSLPHADTSAEVSRFNGRSTQRFFTNHHRDNIAVTPGDICSLLTPGAQSERLHERSSLCCVIISRCLKKFAGMPSQTVVWIRLQESTSDESPYELLNHQAVVSTPRLISQREDTCTQNRSEIIGRLQDGRLFAIYRILLYCDDFKSSGSLYSQSSCGGVYMLPIGMTQKARRSRTAVHVISLTPPGVSTNEILLDIVPDIVKGSKGINGFLPSGEPVVIFLDVVGFVADYPAAAEPLEILGHTADTPCTHCTIRKLKNNSSSAMGFTTKVHATYSPSLRCAERHNALRESALSNGEMNILGMKSLDALKMKEYPLSALRAQLMAARPAIPLTSNGIPVITGLFDPFRSSLIAPDHLLSGLSRNVIDVVFHILRPEERKDLDIAICSALEENSLPRQRSVYNDNKIQLHTMSLSSVFSVLLVFEPVVEGFQLTTDSVAHQAILLIRQLKELIAMTYWSPSVDTDGREVHEMMRKEDGKPYQAFLQGLAERYVMEVDKFCTSHSPLRAILDKPNLHRLLELYQHTIPAFGHVSLFQELVFETAHQPLKRSVARGNHRNAEASAVEHCLGNDWQARIGMLHERLSTGNTTQREAAFNGLRSLLIGRNVATTDLGRQATVTLNNAIENCFNVPLLQAIRSNGTVNHELIGGSMRWTTECEGGPPAQDCEDYSVTDLAFLMEKARRSLLTENGMFGKTKEDVRLKWIAKRKRTASTVGQSSVSMNEVLSPGTVVQATIKRCEERSILLRPQTDGNCALVVFMVLGFLDGGERCPWIVGVRCCRVGRDMIKIPTKIDSEHVQLLLLDEGPRRIAVYHTCKYGDTCHIDRETRKVRHAQTTLSGGMFRIQTRSQGYPPRLA